MKLVSKGLDSKLQVWLLSNDMVAAIKSSGIGLENVAHLPKYQKEIPVSDIIAIAVMNYGMSLKLGNPDPMVFDESAFIGAEGEILRQKIQNAVSEFPRMQLLQAFNAPDQFYVKQTQTGFILCQGASRPECPTWENVEETYFGHALLKSIYNRAGFYQLHFKDTVKALTGEFTLANVFSILV